ncbi:MAG: universal stress protein [Campylobacteraceae bacterium]|nr:universal stress protein [Campylobacteraceae bacterium]
MNLKKMFFPIGGGDELEERLYGAMLVAKYFKVHLEVLKCESHPYDKLATSLNLPRKIQREIDIVLEEQKTNEFNSFYEIFTKVSKEIGIPISDLVFKDEASVIVKSKEGFRSSLVEEASKYCDIVLVAAPPLGVSTATFETAVLSSGKAALMIPRVLKKFDTKRIIIGWNNSTEASRAVTASVEILKQAQKVHIVSSIEYTQDDPELEKLIQYLKCHHIDASYEIIETTLIAGEALLNAALDGNFDLIVAGAYGHKGLKELMFGGGTQYLLKYSSLPIFMTH